MRDHAVAININLPKHVGFASFLSRITYFEKLHIKDQERPRGNFIPHGEFPISVLWRDDKFAEFPNAHVLQAQVPTGDNLSFTETELKFTKKEN